MKPHKLLVLAFIVPGLIAGCDQQPPCEARPTSMVTQPDGTVACFEADGELCDQDPCDEDSGKHKPIKSKSRKK